MRRTIVCLANSYKHGGRCVAGWCVEDRCWIRLRGKAEDGSLTLSECCLADGAGEVRLLDVFEVELHFRLPSDCHPEDWTIIPSSLRLGERPCSAEVWDYLQNAVDKGGPILGGYRDRLRADELQRRPMKASLSLIEPEHLYWWIREERGKRKNRALFQRDHVTYDLPVTDPRWIDQLNLLPVGIHLHRLLAPQAERTYLTISLSEAFQPNGFGAAWHFRIVAGVICR